MGQMTVDEQRAPTPLNSESTLVLTRPPSPGPYGLHGRTGWEQSVYLSISLSIYSRAVDLGQEDGT
jgi:hypothetical protein